MRVPPATFGGRVAVAVGSAVAPPLWVAAGATVSVAAPPAVAPVGEATAAGVVPPAALLVGATVVEPVAHADRKAKENTRVRMTETVFDSLNLALFILLSFVDQPNMTARLE